MNIDKGLTDLKVMPDGDTVLISITGMGDNDGIIQITRDEAVALGRFLIGLEVPDKTTWHRRSGVDADGKPFIEDY